jgi:glycosyltransferase involved in cell wall biosynthesis
MPEVPQNFNYPYRVYRPRSFSILTDYLYRKNIKKMIVYENINILHGQMLHGAGLTAVTMSRIFDIPVVISSHGADVQSVSEIGYGARLNDNLRERLQLACRGADHIITLSTYNREMALAIGADPDKVSIIPNGVLYEEIGEVPVTDIRSKYGLNADDFILITVGRNRPIKRMDLLYQSLSLVNRKISNVKCLSVGPKENLARLVSKYDLENSVILTGPIPADSTETTTSQPFPDLIDLYRGSDLYVSVSYAESFNMSALDALACGTPLLVSKNQGIRDVITEGKTGFTLENETPEGLAQTLISLSRRKNELRDKKEIIRNSVSHLTWDNTAKKLRKIYLSLIH